MGLRFSNVLADRSVSSLTIGGSRINALDDGHERETDRLAGEVVGGQATSSAESGNPSSGVSGDEVLGSPDFDFSGIRIHTDSRAAKSARAINAIAYTVGRDIVFAEGRYDPQTAEGNRLLAHELTRTLQQGVTVPSATADVQRTAATRPADWNTTVSDDHDRALAMLDTARTKLSSYDAANPPEVKTALNTHFKASGTGFAAWVNFNLGYLRLVAPLASYDCEDTSSWWCDPGTEAKTFWCVPFVDIRVCQPLYFSEANLERSRILIHEWGS